MSATQENKVNLEAGSKTGAFIWALFLFLIVAGVNLGYGFIQGQWNIDRVSRAETLRVLSQQVAKNASEASQGNQEAFTQLEDTTREFDQQLLILSEGGNGTSLPRAPEGIYNNEISQTSSLWAQVKTNADTISSGEETVLNLYRISDELSNTIPQMQYLSQQVMDILLDGTSSKEQVMYATRQSLYAQRITSSFQKVLQGGGDAKVASENFGQDVDIYGEVLNGMLNGDAMLGIDQVTDPEAVDALNQIATYYDVVKGNVDYITGSTEALFLIHDASDAIFEQTNTLLRLSEDLSTAFKGSGEGIGPGHWMISAAAGGFVILFILLLYFKQRGEEKSRISRTREARDREKEQNERNQQAIIRLLDEMEGLADGDLTANATVTEDFTGAIADAMNYTIDQLRTLVSTINTSVARLSNATDETQTISQELAQASRNQAQEITGASAAINEMAVSIEQVSANAAESATVAEKSVGIAKKGGEVVRNTISGMDTIREQIQETSKRIKRLGESSQEIGDIVSLINDISDQTNILALNAAIQASMAGEAGRGFAVVADEVQRLAERSGNATKQIEALVKTIQTDTNEAVISMEASTAEVVRGARLAQDAGVALEEIERVSSNLADLIQNISNAARQQAASAGHVSNTMNVIQEITNQTSQGTQNTAASIGKLAELADQLRSSVAGFKLPESM